MLGRQRTGSVICPSCGKLVSASAEECPYCGRKYPGMFGFTSVLRNLGKDLGFVQVVIIGTAFLYVATLVVDPKGIGMGMFSIGSPSDYSLLRFGASGVRPVFGLDRWWTVLSAGWLHGGLLHIGFNLYWLRMLAPETAELYGPGRMVILYTVSSIVGFLASTLLGTWMTVGASASILGLLGAMIAYGRRTGSSIVGRQAWSYAIFMIAFGFLMPRVDNWAHIGGFLAGFATGYVLDPRRPERGNDLLLAVVCLVLTLASIVASLVMPVPLPQGR